MPIIRITKFYGFVISHMTKNYILIIYGKFFIINMNWKMSNCTYIYENKTIFYIFLFHLFYNLPFFQFFIDYALYKTCITQ